MKSAKDYRAARVKRMQEAVRGMGLDPGSRSVDGMKKMLANLGVPVVKLNQFATHHRKSPEFRSRLKKIMTLTVFPCGHPREEGNTVLRKGKPACKFCKNR